MSLSSLPWESRGGSHPTSASVRRKAAIEWGLESGHWHEGEWECEDCRRDGNEKWKSNSEIFKLHNMLIVTIYHCQVTMDLLEV